MEILSTFVEKVLDFTVVPVGRQLGYVLFYNGNIKGLKKEAEKLNAARKDMERKVNAARNNNEEIKETVKIWMREVDEIAAKGEKFFEEESHANTGCSLRSCPNLWLRYQLSWKAKKMAAEVDQRNGEVGKFDEVSTHQVLPQGFGDSSMVREAFESRVSTMKEIMEALIDPAVHLIGLYGLGGVGKTTLAKQVAEKAQDEKLFDRVLVVEVKHNPINEIQNQIADMVGFHFDAQSENRRADELRQRLEQEKSLLIVLDDLWERLDFKQVGIPSADEPNTQRKFIFTSRNASLLSSQMNCKRNILVGLLSEEEAWVLFKEMAEINEHVDEPDLVLKANEVSQKCARLPVAIVAVARALRNNKSLVDWKDALQRLKCYSSRNNSITKEVDSSIRLSYGFLENEELKSTFLLSAMFSQDPLIMDLFMYAVGLGFLDDEDVHDMEGARNRLEALVHQLKASSLLLDSYSKDRFTIHDVVRDVALSIAFEVQHALVKRRAKVDKWPNDERLEKCIIICLDRSDINELPEDLYGPKVEFFYLYNKDRKLSMPSNFFRRMQELKVLSLSSMTFSLLPSSISLLQKLITLSFHSCTLEDISVVGNLKNLKILNLSSSRIEELPCEVGQLSSLQILNLSWCRQLKVIPPNLLSSLNKLEELYMGGSFNLWKANGLNDGKDNASLDELKNLRKLSALEIDIPNASVLPKDLFVEILLERYKISIGGCCYDYYSYEFSRTLRLAANSNINMEYGVFRLFESVEDLYLQNLNGIASLHQSHITAQTFRKLRAIKVSRCDQLKSLFLVSMAGTLSKLETIEVSECKSLEEIVAFSDEENVVKGSTMNVIEFLQLRSLKLKDLPALTDFCFNKKVTFSNLETLCLTSINCESIWDVFMSKSSETQISEIVESSQIRIVSEDPLPNRSFSKLKTLVVVDCKSLENIFPVSIAKGLIQLEELQISDCGIEVVVAKDEFPLEPDTAFVLPKLRKLKIQNCKNLKIFQLELPDAKYSLCLDEKVISKLEELSLIGLHAQMMWNGEFRGFCFLNVKFLSLSGIYNKTEKFPYSLFHGFPNLEQLQLRNTSFEVIFSRSERSLDNDAQENISIKRLKLVFMSRLKHIWDGRCQVDHILQNLESLYVKGCGSLINLGSSFVSLQNLTDLDVFDCHELINLLAPSTARTLVQLTRLKIKRCRMIEEIITNGEEDEENDIVFMKLKILELDELSSCKSFCCHGYNFKFPFLNEVIIRGCPRFRIFCPGNLITPLLKGVKVADENIHWKSNLNKTIQQLFDQKVFFIGGDIKIDEYPELIDTWNEKCTVSNLSFGNLTSLIMDKCAFLSNYVIPSYVLISLINLEKLEVRNCESVEVVFDLEGIDIDKEARALRAICLQRLELRHLSNLKYVWNKDPHTVNCFQYLQFMSAYDCESLRSIFPASIAKGLTWLHYLRIESCGIEVIVAEDHTPSPTIHFMFPRLLSLYLIKLPNLKNFYPQRHTVEWPRLKYMIVRQCKKVKIFSWDDPKIIEKETEDGVENQYSLFLLEKVTFSNLETLRLASIPCQSIWDICMSKSSEIQIPEIVESSQIRVVSKDPLPDGSFSNLKTLVVFDCKFLLKLIPLYILKSLNHLEALEISGCDLLEEVFHFGPFNNYGEAHTSRLKRLILRSLSKLKTVWGRGSEGIVNFLSLQQINVRECRSLESVFPASIAKGLTQLEELQISDCGIEVVVAEDEFPLEADVTFVFPEFWKLKIENCDKLKIFQLELPDAKYSLCLDEKVIPKLKELSLIGMHAKMMWNGKFRGFCFLNVKSLSLSKIYGKTGTFPYSLFHGFPNLEQLQLCNASFKVIFPCSERSLDNDAQETISIKGLKLVFMSWLKHIWDGRCQVDHILQNLETLYVEWCNSLINLGSSFVSLQNLIDLDVSNCDKLINLLSPSTARTLVQLTRLKIKKCKKIEEIITDGDKDEEKDIVFMKLKILELDELSHCKSFCCHSYNFKFPFLDEVIIGGCPKFRMFCPGNLTTPLLKGLKVANEKIHWQSNLNKTIQQLFDKKVLFTGALVKIDEYPELIEIWYGKCAVSNFPFSNLTSLIVDKCAFLSKYVIPSHVLISLINLENLEVRNCESAEVVFDLEGIDIDKEARTLQAIPLCWLELRHLPNLKCVWNKDPHTVHCFQYLDSMSAYECEGLRSIFPISIAKGLINLSSLKIESCGVEVIVAEDHTPSPTIHFVFPRLFSLHLIKLPNLKNFYPQRHTVEWPSIQFMNVKECKKVKVFSWEDPKITEKETEDGAENQYPLFLLEKVTFPKLETLRLASIPCQSIWDICISKSSEIQIPEIVESSQIKVVSKDQLPDGSFSNLKTLVVVNCKFLLKLIPLYILKSLSHLEQLEISGCDLLEEVFHFGRFNNYGEAHTSLLKRLILKSLSKLKTVWGRGSKGIVNFSSLQQINVRECRSLESVFPASIAKSLIQLVELQISDCGIEVLVAEDEFPLEADATFVFPEFRKLKIENCDKLKIFQSELPDAKYSLCLDEKVIPKLEELNLIGMHATMMWNVEFRGFNFLNVKSLSLSEIYDETRTFPYSLFHGFPNLEQLQLCNAFFKVIFSCSERPLDNDAGKTISIKELKLFTMKRLKHIWDGKCQVDHILQNLETLYVDSCHRLINLGSSFVSLQNLIDLDVSNCDKLINLLSPSTARTLVQLIRLKIKRCKKIEEIITDGEEDEEKDVVFMKLKILELDGLSSCKSFCCHSYNFKFPFLDEVIIRGCPRFRMFCPGNLTTPLLKGVKVTDEKIHWQSNLNEIIQQLFDKKVLFTGLDVKIDEYPELIDIWNGKCAVSNFSFSNLTSLIVDKCAFLSKYVIPSHVLISLINLEKLEVRNCESVEVVFDLEGIDIDKEARALRAICLQRLELRHLPNLKCVWNKDPHTVHCFQYLQFMSAYECESLRSIFPASIAKGLIRLEDLRIKSCGVEVIVAEDHTPSPTIHFVFPKLWRLYLIKLSNLKNFYPQRHTVEWPRLKYMNVRQCKKVKVFNWEDPKITEKETEVGAENQYPLFLLEKVFLKLCQLVLNQDHVKMIRNDQFQYDLFNEVSTLGLDSFNEDEPLVFLYAVLEKFPKLKYLNVSHSSCKNIFACHRPPSDPSRKLPLLTSLSLTHLDQQNIWNKDSQTCPIFQSLKSLDIKHCHHLGYLLTTSTAKSLMHLETMMIKDCEKMEEIVTNEGKALEDIIGLKKLNAMKLVDLPILKNFCSQACTFEFPSLTDVTIRGCSKMKMFCLGVLATPLLEDVQVEEDKERWEGNLNKTIEQLFLEKEGLNSLEG